MRIQNTLLFCAIAATVHFASIERAAAQFAVEVVSYNASTTAATGYESPAAALGSPERISGEGVFPGVVSPFNPPFLSSEIVSIGETGHLTLRLSHYVLPQAGGPEIGVFSNFGLVDAAYPAGIAGSPAGGFSAPDSAHVEVSENGAAWTSLGTFALDIPTNGYTDLADPFSATPGSVTSDFQLPFAGSLSSFDGLPYSHTVNFDMLDLLAGSGGGKWLDISASGLAQVGFIRFSVPDDMTSLNFNFELDSVSIAQAALGAATVPEPGTIMLAGLLVLPLAQWRRRSQARRPRAAESGSVPAR